MRLTGQHHREELWIAGAASQQQATPHDTRKEATPAPALRTDAEEEEDNGAMVHKFMFQQITAGSSKAPVFAATKSTNCL